MDAINFCEEACGFYVSVSARNKLSAIAKCKNCPYVRTEEFIDAIHELYEDLRFQNEMLRHLQEDPAIQDI